jgi:hypothetical protein
MGFHAYIAYAYCEIALPRLCALPVSRGIVWWDFENLVNHMAESSLFLVGVGVFRFQNAHEGLRVQTAARRIPQWHLLQPSSVASLTLMLACE